MPFVKHIVNLKSLTDSTWKWIIVLSSVISFLILLLITIFIAREGASIFSDIGILDFITGTTWSVKNDQFGILPMIIGTAYVTFLALIMSVPLGVACSIFLAEVAPARIREIFRPAVELLVGIPSVVYGLVGLLTVVPLIRNFGGSGDSVLAAAIVLTIMVLPTIISISEDSIRAVPKSFKEGALALGATPWQAMWRVTLPAARSGILASIVLGMGRAIGETMAMIMVIGNALIIPESPLDPARTLTGTLAMEFKYAAGTHWDALFATGVVLFVFILLLNSFAMVLRRRRQAY